MIDRLLVEEFLRELGEAVERLFKQMEAEKQIAAPSKTP